MSITNCVKTEFFKRTVEKLPRCCHGAWHGTLYRCTFGIAFSSIRAVNALKRSAKRLCAMCRVTEHKRLKDDNYHVITVIRIWATLFHKFHLMVPLKTRNTVSQDYSVMTIKEKNSSETPIMSNYGQWWLRHKRKLDGKGHENDFAPHLNVLVRGNNTNQNLDSII